jgi:hypothetical protein
MALVTWTIMPIDAPFFGVPRLEHQAGAVQ